MARLEVRQLTVTADGRTLVDRVSLALRSGELVSLIGPNGAGKSTILRAIIGSQKRQGGELTLDGKPVAQWASAERARCLSYLPQERQVNWNMIVLDIVRLGRFPHLPYRNAAEDDKAVLEALDRVGARHLEKRRYGVLSGGEKALVLLARTLAVQAPLMLIDEPIAGLDPYHQLQVMEVLRQVTGQDTGILMVLHDLTLAARYSDRLLLLSAGRIRADGQADEVLSDVLLAETFGVEVRRAGTGSDAALIPWRRLSP